jgi:hypothetical protein
VDVDTDTRYRVKGRDGVAWYIARGCDQFADEDETDCLHGECVIMVMVGDDVGWHTQASELIEINDDEYCGGCGQIGCGHG